MIPAGHLSRVSKAGPRSQTHARQPRITDLARRTCVANLSQARSPGHHALAEAAGGDHVLDTGCGAPAPPEEAAADHVPAPQAP